MSNKIKTFVANYLATFLEGEYVEAEGDIRHYPKTYDRVINTSDTSKPPERQGGFLPSDKIPLFKPKPSPTSVLGIVKSVPANTPALAASQKGMTDKVKAASDAQKETARKAELSRDTASVNYGSSDKKETKKLAHYQRRNDYKKRDIEGPLVSIERKGQIVDPGKERYHGGEHSNATTIARDAQPAYPVTKSVRGRSPNGAVTIKSQSTVWKSGGKQGDVVATAPGISSLSPAYQPPIRANLPAAPHIANTVTNALMRATKDPEKRKLLSLQKKASVV